MALSQIQQKTIEHLKEKIVNERILEARCPLDNGKHDCATSSDAHLGNLHALPPEIQQHILSFLDIKSLLTFRRVSKPGMSLVNSNQDYYKVVTNAPMALRMAIAIRMHDKYTIAELFAALCQRTCVDCGTLTHYVCLFSLRRVCLDQNGYCAFNSRNWKLVDNDPRDYEASYDTWGRWRFKTGSLENLTSFTLVPGHYSVARYIGIWCIKKSVCITPGDVVVDLPWHVQKTEKITLDHPTIPNLVPSLLLSKSLSVIVAPWLSNTSLVGAYGTQCCICKEEYEKRHKMIVPDLLSWKNVIDLRQCEILTEDGFMKHMHDDHGGN